MKRSFPPARRRDWSFTRIINSRVSLIRAIGPVILISILSSCVAVPALVVTGAAGGAYVANDRRPAETMFTDQRIQKTAASRLEDQLRDDVRMNAISYNRNVLLIGEARSEHVKQRAAKIVEGVDGVRDVYNEVQVTDKLGFHSVQKDAALSSQVKARMVGSEFANPLNVHVSTENGVVYLMGLVTHKEADEYSRIAASTGGVKRVVRVFEYIPDSAVPAAQNKGAESKGAATGTGELKATQ